MSRGGGAELDHQLSWTIDWRLQNGFGRDEGAGLLRVGMFRGEAQVRCCPSPVTGPVTCHSTPEGGLLVAKKKAAKKKTAKKAAKKKAAKKK